MKPRPTISKTTDYLGEERQTIVIPHQQRREFPKIDHKYGLQPASTDVVQRLPRDPKGWRSNLQPKHIELHSFTDLSCPALKIEMLGDIVLGIDRQDECTPDLDLGKYGAEAHGVSRCHALIRPTPTKLYLVDLDSTNGTMHNALPVQQGTAAELRHGDIVTLGSLSFTIYIDEQQ